MTTLREQVLALAVEWTDPYCKACSVTPEFALAVMALCVEHHAKVCRETKYDGAKLSCDRLVYNVGCEDCYAAIRGGE